MSVRGANLLSLVLAGACGVLLLLDLALEFGLGRGYRWLDADRVEDPGLTVAGIDREPFKLPPETAFAAIEAKPIFNEDRKPTPETPDEPAAPPPPSAPLNIALTGVVLTPQVRMALIQDKTRNVAVALKEGMPMPGDQGGWTLTEIKPRSVVFKETNGDEVEVELSTAVAGQKPGAPPRAAGAPVAGAKSAAVVAPVAPPVAPPAAQPNPQSAEQLQRRIEERRRQMREEAERLKQPQNPAQH
jgi:general secretion pathway protein N